MKRVLLAGLLAAGCSAARAQTDRAVETMQQPQIINLSLLEALIAMDAQDLSGIFSFVPEAGAPLALADHLLRHNGRLKRFVKKGERDLREAGGVNEWDRQVFLHIVALQAAGAVPPGLDRLSPAWMGRVSTLATAPALPLAEVTARRKGR